ncbi:MAG TPA: hypothetical protein VFF50_10070, partial [Candidatus Deferrimicrobiaceae bacterium]|nr:hypothetical protein [Candidatus Deferrimicrobiaceae bacterium]
VLGVFELLSGQPRAFDERDLSALLRLSEMVEAAVRHAFPAQIAPPLREIAVAESQPAVEEVIEEEVKSPPPEPLTAAVVSSAPTSVRTSLVVLPPETPPGKVTEPPAGKKALFWSAALRAQGGEPLKQNDEASAVPPVLRNFQKCQACGFPVSQGRTFCVECEEKQWRGQRIAQPPVPRAPVTQQLNQQSPESKQSIPKQSIPNKNAQEILIQDSQTDQLSMPLVVESELALPAPGPDVIKISQELKPVTTAIVEVASTSDTLAATSTPSSSDVSAGAPADVLSSTDAAPFLSSALQSESWFASNKYVLAALLVVAIVIGAVAWLR